MVSPFKTALTVVSADSASSDAKIAVAICSAMKAHLSVLVVDIALTARAHYYGQAHANQHGQQYSHGRKAVEHQISKIRKLIADAQLSGDVTGACVPTHEIEDLVSTRAKYSDVTIVYRGSSLTQSMHRHALFGALFQSGRSVLLVPIESTNFPIVRQAMIAWNGGTGCSRAVRDAISILRAADQVSAVLIDSQVSIDEQERADQAGIDIVGYLARHGIGATVERIRSEGDDVANLLLAHAEEINADLIVMGGYGRSRLRQRLFGGTTRYMVEEASVPVFMSH